MGIVPQDTVLFHDTIGYNIKYGNLNATDNEVYGAALKAHLHQTVVRMAHGYKTIVGHRGAMVSGGERQRVSVVVIRLLSFFDIYHHHHERKLMGCPPAPFFS